MKKLYIVLFILLLSWCSIDWNDEMKNKIDVLEDENYKLSH